MQRIATIIRKVIKAGAGALVGLTLGEFLLRLLVAPPPIIEVRSITSSTARVIQEDHGILSDLESLPDSFYIETPRGRRLRRNAEAVIRNHALSRRDITLRTNSLGMRGKELGPKATPRVLFLGDSITFGDFVQESESFVYLVEGLARQQAGVIETINAGVGGIGIEDELAILIETGLRVEPDIVVVCFYLNDVQPSPGVRVTSLPKYLEWSRVARLASDVIENWDSNVDVAGRVPASELKIWRDETRLRYPPGQGNVLKNPEAFNALMQNLFNDWGSAWSDGAWSRMEPILGEFVRFANIHGFRLLVAVFPVQLQVAVDYEYDHPQQRLKEVAKGLDIPVLDLLPILRKEMRSATEPIFYDHCHHTPYGQRLIAEQMVRFVLDNLKQVHRLDSP